MGSINTNFLPATQGLSLGSVAQPWNAILNNATLGANGTPITQITVYSPSLTPTSLTAQTTAEQTFAVSGLATTDKVLVIPPAWTVSTALCSARVSATNTLALTFVNPTAGSLTPPSGTYVIVAFRS